MQVAYHGMLDVEVDPSLLRIDPDLDSVVHTSRIALRMNIPIAGI